MAHRLLLPGCGSLRAVHDLATGQVAAALHRNPLTVLAVPFLLVMWGLSVQRRMTGRSRRVRTGLGALDLLGAILTFWLLRNLPGFGWLGP